MACTSISIKCIRVQGCLSRTAETDWGVKILFIIVPKRFKLLLLETFTCILSFIYCCSCCSAETSFMLDSCCLIWAGCFDICMYKCKVIGFSSKHMVSDLRWLSANAGINVNTEKPITYKHFNLMDYIRFPLYRQFKHVNHSTTHVFLLSKETTEESCKLHKEWRQKSNS